METKVSGGASEVMISYDRPAVIIGERINPTGKKKMMEALQTGDMGYVLSEAQLQISQGAEILDVNVGAAAVDEASLLAETVQMLQENLDVPLCIDSAKASALESALQVYRGKPLINSVTGEENSLKTVLPLVKEYKAAVIGIPFDEKGIPSTAEERYRIACKIVEHADSLGIPSEDIIIDCLAQSLATDSGAGLVAIETTKRISNELDLNVTVGASNISFGMPDRDVITSNFLALALYAGITCPILNPAVLGQSVLSVDLMLGRDKRASRYIRYYRQKKRLLKTTVQ